MNHTADGLFILLLVSIPVFVLLLLFILHQLTTIERKICKAMGQVTEKIAEVAEAVNDGFASLEQTITTEIEQVAVLIQQNETTHALNALENLKARVAEGFASARNSVASIVPDAPIVEEPPAVEPPAEETPGDETPTDEPVDETPSGEGSA